MSSSSSSSDCEFTYITVGDSGVGKSCLIHRFVHDRFVPDNELTIGSELGTKITTIDNVPIKLRIWDTTGQERFRSITRSYYRSSCAALLVYDISRRETFNHVESWLEDAREYGNEKMTIMLVGNKCDLAARKREVSTLEGELFAKVNGLLGFMETSCKTTQNVKPAFEKMTLAVLTKIRDPNFDASTSSSRAGIKIRKRGIAMGGSTHDDEGLFLPPQQPAPGFCCSS